MGRNFEMTLEESIALAEKFQKDLAQLESYERQIIDNEAESKKPIVVDVILKRSAWATPPIFLITVIRLSLAQIGCGSLPL